MKDPVTFSNGSMPYAKSIKKSPVVSRRLFFCLKYLRVFTLQKTDILHTEVGVGRNFVNFWPKFFEKMVAEEAAFLIFSEQFGPFCNMKKCDVPHKSLYLLVLRNS